MIQKIFYSLLSVMVLVLSGCNTLTDDNTRNDLAVELTIKYATMKVIEHSGDPAAKATRVAEIAGHAKALVGAGSVAVIPELETIVRSKIPWSELDAADTLLADALLSTLRSELMSRVNGGTLDDNTRLTVARVLDSVVEVTRMFPS